MATGRQDSHRIALRPREYQRKQGGYEYRWREAIGKDENGKTLYKQHAIVAQTLPELRKMEDELKRTELAGIKPKQDMTLNECVDCWFKIKRGLRDNTRQNYVYMYNKFVRRSMLGSIKIQELKKSDLISFYNRLTDKGALSISTCEVLQNVIGPMVRAGVSLATLAKLLGHATVDITAIVYVDAQQDVARDVDEKSLSALRKAGVLPAGDISDT
jgi:hypothetical protein